MVSPVRVLESDSIPKKYYLHKTELEAPPCASTTNELGETGTGKPDI